MHTAGKVWGKTANIFSNPNFEVHRIEVNKGGYCSKHKHKYKFNAFYVESGELDIIIYKNDYDLVAGNTRIAGCFAKNIDQKIWVVDLQPYYTKEEAKEKAEEESFRKNKK